MTDFATKSARIADLRAKGASVSYEIAINEAQRVALLELIFEARADRANGPLEYWVGMLEGLAAVEAESPGILHGFCL